MASKNTKTAAIFGVTGLVGRELARSLLSSPDWKVYGVARHEDPAAPSDHGGRYQFLPCDLLDPSEARDKLSRALTDVTHVFWVTWACESPLDSSKCYEQNRAMMANALDSILPVAKALEHVSLQTGTKHYISFTGPAGWETAARFDEDSPRVCPSGNNFYYGLEDLLRERLSGHGAGWSVHRPGVIVGSSRRTFFNFIGSICVYGEICKHLNLPFVFHGTRGCWEEMYVDVSDARLVAEQHVWAATSDDRAVSGQAFNAINGEDYTWREVWGAIGARLGVGIPPNEDDLLFSESESFSSVMGDKGGIWKEIVEKEGLVEVEMGDLANWAFLDMLFRCPVKLVVSRRKADQMGFDKRYRVLESIFYWIDVMRAEKLILDHSGSIMV